jgi:hypothetical protein
VDDLLYPRCTVFTVQTGQSKISYGFSDSVSRASDQPCSHEVRCILTAGEQSFDVDPPGQAGHLVYVAAPGDYTPECAMTRSRLCAHFARDLVHGMPLSVYWTPVPFPLVEVYLCVHEACHEVDKTSHPHKIISFCNDLCLEFAFHPTHST